MSAAPIMHEPADPADLPVVYVSPDLFDRIATTLGAGPVECDGERSWVAFNGAEYVTDGARFA